MPKKKNAASAVVVARAGLQELQTRLYSAMNVAQTVGQAAYSEERSEPDHAVWGSMQVLARELQAVINMIEALSDAREAA